MNQNTQPLQGKRALVCGASQGIGRAIAKKLAQSGAEVIALSRSEETLQELVQELKKSSGNPTHHFLSLDIEDRVVLKEKIQSLIQQMGSIEILVNNSGGPPAGPILEATEEAFTKAFSRLILSPHLLVQLLLPEMKKQGYGRIINIISTSVREPIPNLGVSNTIRGATASWAKTLSQELPPGVTINNVLPGFTATERLGALKKATATRLGKSENEVHEMWLGTIPEKRLAEPHEIADAVNFLASPLASYIRGVSLAVDGGRLKSI